MTQRLTQISTWLCTLIGLTALLTLVGWQFDLAFFKRPIPRLVAMHPLTAISLLMASGSLALQIRHRAKRASQLMACLPLGVGALALTKRLSGWGPSLQTLLFEEKLKADAVGNLSNLMAPNTAFCFLLVGLALLWLHATSQRSTLLVQRIALLIGAFSLMALFGYAYQVQAFYGALVSYPMAIHTASCFLLMAIAMLLSTADRGFMQQIMTHLSGGVLGRSLLMATLLVPFGLGWLILSGYWNGWWSAELAMALFASGLTAILIRLIWQNIRFLNRNDQQQLDTQAFLRQQEEQIQTIFRAAPDAILVFTRQGRLITWNAQAVQLLGLPDHPGAHTLSIQTLLTPDSLLVFQAEVDRFSTTENHPLSRNLEMIAFSTNQEVTVEVSLSATRIQGQPVFIGFIRDLTAKQLAAQQLKQANADLLRSNDSLQQFASVASHDLQEPLRKVQAFGDLLKSQYGDQLGEGMAYLDRMQAAASRMSMLIKDLLSFARLSTHPETKGKVTLAAVIQTVVADLDLVIAETGAQVTVNDLPTVEGDRSQLEQLFQNLLSNGLKFRQMDQAGVPVTPQLQIIAHSVPYTDLPPSVKPTQKTAFYYRIDVSDNGIGFDEKYLDRIFQVFQRLHTKNKFSGTGIGLAICQKVAENHGGVITARSQPGKGSTFSVYLPDR